MIHYAVKFLTCLFFCCSVSAFANTPYFHQVTAKKGDSIYNLLKRYYLADHECNFDKFFKLNDLNPKDFIIAGKKYQIPIYIYDYDGKSIKSTLNSTDWEMAHRIKQYNDFILKDGHRKQTIINSKILWVPFHELNCLNKKIELVYQETKIVDLKEKQNAAVDKTETKDNKVKVKNELPLATAPVFMEKGSGKNRHYLIFGEKYAYTPLMDNKLKGKIFYVVSGHGGPDPGAMGKRDGHTLCEDEYAYDVALRLTRNLISHGATAYMITRDDDDGIREGSYLKCDTDERYWGTDKTMSLAQKIRLRGRSGTVNRLYQKHKKQGIKNQYMVAIHIDSRGTKAQTDLFFYHYPNSTEGKKLAKTLQKTIRNKYRLHNPSRNYDGTVTGRNLHMLRETNATNVYIELGNIRNPFDQKRFVIESNRQALADWLCDGFLEYTK